MKILIASLNYKPELTGTGPYSAGLAEAMAARGHQIEVIAGNPFYPHWKLFDGYRWWKWHRSEENNTSVLRCPIFIPAKINGLTRLLHYASFAATSFVPIIWRALRMRPDIVLNVAPTIMSGPACLLAARLTGATSQLHIQDFEIEAGFATNQLSENSLVGKLALRFGDWMIKSFDHATTISPAMVARLLSKGHKASSVMELRNWAEIDDITPSDHSDFRAQWGITTPHVALYSGSIAKKQGIDLLIEVARLMAGRKDITFIICGNGPTQDELRASASDLTNIQFHDLQPFERLGDLLNLATIHLLPQKADAADLVLPSKLTNMLASGRPVVAGSAPGTGLATEIDGCGIAVEPENAPAMADAIIQLMENPAQWRQMAKTARARALSHWHRSSILDGYEQAIRSWVSRKAIGKKSAKQGASHRHMQQGLASRTPAMNTQPARNKPSAQTLSDTQVVYFCPDVTDMKLFARVAAMERAGASVMTIGFRRERYDTGRKPHWPHIDLGAAKDRAYVSRLTALVTLLRNIPKLRRFLQATKGRKIIVARNLDMALLAIAVRRTLGPGIKLFYEVLDIQHIMVKAGWKSALARWLERACLARANKLIVSSPHFVTEYFKRIQSYSGAWELVENKIVNPLPPLKDGPTNSAWVIGWLGTLRCKRSLTMICEIAAALKDKVRIDLHGYPARIGEDAFFKAIKPYDNIVYHGSYNHDQLPAMMRNMHFSWCFDYSDDWGNSRWLWPNRLYEAGYYQRPLLADETQAIGQRIKNDQLGWTFTPATATADIIALLSKLTADEWQHASRHIANRPSSDYVDMEDFARALAQ